MGARTTDDRLEAVERELAANSARLADVLDELRARRRKGVKRSRTVARNAAARVESVPVTDLHRAQARKYLRRAGLR